MLLCYLGVVTTMDADFQRTLLRRLLDLRAQGTTSMADSVRWQ